MTTVGGLCVQANESPSTSLKVKVAPGSFRHPAGNATAYAGGTITLAANATSMVWYDPVAGALASGLAWPATGPYVPLATAAAGVSTITSVADARVPYVALGDGGGWAPVRTVTGATTANAADGTIRCDATGGSFAITLLTPSAALAGKVLTIKKVDSTANTVPVNGSIDGASAKTLGSQYATVRLQCNGSTWDLLSTLGTVT